MNIGLIIVAAIVVLFGVYVVGFIEGCIRTENRWRAWLDDVEEYNRLMRVQELNPHRGRNENDELR